MNIAVFCKKTTFHKGFGGLEVQNKVLCEGLHARNHTVTVFSPKQDVSDLEKTENGVRYIFVESTYKYFMSNVDKNSWFNRSTEYFEKEHSKTPFDIVLGQSSAAIGIIHKKKQLKVKVISISHGSTLGELKTFYINNHALTDLPRLVLNTQYSLRQFFGRQRQFILGSDKVVAVSSAVKDQLIEETFASSSHIEVINNGINPIILSDTPKASKKLLYIGQLSKDKGVKLFLDIQKDLRFKDFELDVIGDGPMLSTFQSKYTEHNNVLKINLLGKLSNEATLEKLKNSSGAILLFPTKRIEGFPMVLVEAMFAGLPIVAYDLGGVRDAITDNETGYLVPFENKDYFVKRVLELALDPVKMEYMSKNAREKAEKLFSLGSMLDKYEKVIQEVLKK